MDKNIKKLYDYRFGVRDKKRKNDVWIELCAYFRRFFKVGNLNCIVDVAAGYCNFINHIGCNCKKYAIDVNPDVKKYAGRGVVAIIDDIGNLDKHFGEGTVSLFFMSNFLEHISKKEISQLMKKEYRLLEKGGEVWILTPNIRYTGEKYWDFYDHITPVTEKSLIEEARLIGFQIKKSIPKFLPFTTKSRLPQARWIVRLYLMFMPLSGKIFGEQSFLVLSKQK